MRLPLPHPLGGGLLRPFCGHPLRIAILAALLARRTVLRPQKGSSHVSADERLRAIADLRRMVPPPPASQLGGERVTADTYGRFLAVCDWNVARATRLLERDLHWRSKYQPRALKPHDMPKACAQRGWEVLTLPVGGRAAGGLSSPTGTGCRSGGGSNSGGTPRLRGRFWRRLTSGTPAIELHPPHTRPPMQQWRYTRNGMPITYFLADAWHPERVPHDERVQHVAYQMEHYIRRMPLRGHSHRVQRACIILDMTGFRPTTLPQVKECIDVLRNRAPDTSASVLAHSRPTATSCKWTPHVSCMVVSTFADYPGRLGVAAFINVPPYFHPVWKLISPLLDDEVRIPTAISKGGSTTTCARGSFHSHLRLNTFPYPSKRPLSTVASVVVQH